MNSHFRNSVVLFYVYFSRKFVMNTKRMNNEKQGNITELIQRMKPLLEKYHAQFYFCGHDHDFHICMKKEKMWSTGCELRLSTMNELSLFSN